MREFCEGWCPPTNTLHTSLGKMSISLWDLYRLGGLPIFGRLYDEAIPCYEELIGSDKIERFIPKSCEHLFAAFHLLNSKKEGEDLRVLASDWVSFWCRYGMKYPKPPSRRTKRLSCAIKTHNPNGSLNKFQGWSKCGKKPFIELEIEDGLWEETYLAALFSCWLCTFVLPSEDPNTIRPETFQVASFLATGHPFCLAIPVLVSLYRGLNKIAHSSPMISRSGACFPVHYIYGWLGFKTHYEIDVPGSKMVVYSGEGGAKHFDEHEARKLIQGTSIQWDTNLYVRNR